MKKLKRIEKDDTSIFDQIIKQTPAHETILYQISMSVANQIADILERKGMMQKDLADLLGKSEAEVSKWLSGLHNFTFKSVAKIQAVLGEPILMTPYNIKREMVDRLTTILHDHFHRIQSEIIVKAEKVTMNRQRLDFMGSIRTRTHVQFSPIFPTKVVEMKRFKAAVLTNTEDQLQPTGT